MKIETISSIGDKKYSQYYSGAFEKAKRFIEQAQGKGISAYVQYNARTNNVREPLNNHQKTSNTNCNTLSWNNLQSTTLQNHILY